MGGLDQVFAPGSSPVIAVGVGDAAQEVDGVG